jgi:serine/threonine protein kinase
MVVEILDVARGLEYLHSMEPALTHGDLKGVSMCAYLCFWEVQVLYLQVNILITSSGRACIADFGIATARDSYIEMTTTSFGAKGTRHFMAPELLDTATDLQKLDRRPCDMYALACVCYEVGKTISPFGLTYDKTYRCSLGCTRSRTGRILCL